MTFAPGAIPHRKLVSRGTAARPSCSNYGAADPIYPE